MVPVQNAVTALQNDRKVCVITMMNIIGLEKIENEAVSGKVKQEWMGAVPPGWNDTVHIDVMGDHLNCLITAKYTNDHIVLYKVFDGQILLSVFLTREDIDFLNRSLIE